MLGREIAVRHLRIHASGVLECNKAFGGLEPEALGENDEVGGGVKCDDVMLARDAHESHNDAWRVEGRVWLAYPANRFQH